MAQAAALLLLPTWAPPTRPALSAEPRPSAPLPSPPPGSCHLNPHLPPQTPDHLKTSTAEEAFNPNGLSQRTIRLLKDAFPDLEVGLEAAGALEGGGSGGGLLEDGHQTDSLFWCESVVGVGVGAGRQR
jgi:hypothetical protein